jgi:cysteine-rich repeat protein
MKPRLYLLVLAAGLSLPASCTQTYNAYVCSNSSECTLGQVPGTCEATGYCSFPSAVCISGRRYGQYSAPDLVDTCVPPPSEDTVVAVACGNGEVDPTEECDDGNQTDTDGCRNSCRWARCGDGVVRPGVESCDDGNDISSDGCNTFCQPCPEGTSCSNEVPWRIRLETNHAYLRIGTDASWIAARDDCTVRGGHLVTLTSLAEYNFVRAGLSARYWLGATDSTVEGQFRWITGEPFGPFAPFVEGQPDDTTASQNCVADYINQDGWQDDPCSTPRDYVCEVD